MSAVETSTTTAPGDEDKAADGRPLGTRRGMLTGLGAGLVAIGCCVGPTVAALLGVMSAATAADVANDLYADWGWAFKTAGVIAGVGALLVARRRARACGTGGRRGGRFVLVLAATGIATYFALYAATTWLGELAT